MALNTSSMQGPEARAFAVSIIDELCALKLAITPANYEVWHAYRLDDRGEVAKVIEAAIASGRVAQTTLDALYASQIAGSAFTQNMIETGDTLARELSDVIDILRSAGDQTRSYGEALLAASALEAGEADPALFRTLVRNLAAATRQMNAHNESLSAQIEQSAEQVKSLQTALSHVTTEALTDGLTGIANRRCFDATLLKRLADAKQMKTALCLIVCDIDHFKRINDGWGHGVGDQVIRYVAQICAASAPKDALAARIGGEEFALILPATARAEAHALAEAMRVAMRQRRIIKKSTGESIGPITASFGVAEGLPIDDAAALLARADRHLYGAKTNGRNQVVSDRVAAAA
jgi:diguanylate cyclase